jgi:hypothetical protein
MATKTFMWRLILREREREKWLQIFSMWFKDVDLAGIFLTFDPPHDPFHLKSMNVIAGTIPPCSKSHLLGLRMCYHVFCLNDFCWN